MSLRLRLVALIGVVLLVGMLLGALAAGYQVRRALSEELTSGLAGARQTVASAFEDLPQSDHAARDLRQLVATFDGNRHVRATLLSPGGKAISTSRTEAIGRSPPPWFRRLLGPAPGSVAVPVPGAGQSGGRGSIVLTPTAEIDVGVAWREFLGVVSVLSGSAAVGLGLVYLVIGAAFRPLTALAAQFGRVGAGDYGGRVPQDGPSELLSLQQGFNRMAGELAATTERNQLLTDQLLTIQEEERADIARDLHDEIGPHLFAVNLDAEMIAQLNEAGRPAAIPDQVRAIQSAVGHMQRQVRDLLGRLRPTNVTELGLNAAIIDLVRFWTARRPDIAFDLNLLADEGPLPSATRDLVYRIVQEAANNAVRHGDPTLIRIGVERDGARGLTVCVIDDGARGGQPNPGGGMGLVGMRERIAQAGGALSFGPNPSAAGWTTTARLHLQPASAPEAPAPDRPTLVDA